MAKQKEIAIAVKDLHKSFKLPHEQHSGIKQAILNLFKRNRKKGYEMQKVLKGLDFEIEKGDFFGIVGRNGSGKSTLLKTLAGIYSPDKGAVEVNGTLVPFIELGVGFNPELTGRENVFLNGALLGFSRDEMEAMYDEIVEFAELEKFMDQKLKNYSSGMQVRLAFSIAIRADADILLLDEVLAVGDEAFQRKCDDFFNKIKKDKRKTVILVTHSMESVKKYCNKAMMLRKGAISAIGDPSDVANEYTNDNVNSSDKDKVENTHGLNKGISSFTIKSKSKNVISSSQSIFATIEYTIAERACVDAIVIEVCDLSRGNVPIVLDAIKGLDQKKGTYRAEYELELNNINEGYYRITSTLRDKKRNVLAFTPANSSVEFAIRNEDERSSYPLLRIRGKVEYVKNK